MCHWLCDIWNGGSRNIEGVRQGREARGLLLQDRCLSLPFHRPPHSCGPVLSMLSNFPAHVGKFKFSCPGARLQGTAILLSSRHAADAAGLYTTCCPVATVKSLKSGQQGFVFMHPLQSLYPDLPVQAWPLAASSQCIRGVFPRHCFVKALLVSFLFCYTLAQMETKGKR